MPNSSNLNDGPASTRSLNELFKDGVLLQTAGNAPVLLSDKDSFWIVQQGEVDVFAVRMENRQPAGARLHLFRAPAGTFLFGLDLENAAANDTLIGVGTPGTQLQRFAMEQFATAWLSDGHSRVLVEALEKWIGLLSLGFAEKVSPPGSKYTEIDVDAPVKVPAGTLLRSSHKLVWLETRGQAVWIGGDRDLPVYDGNLMFPLCKGVWLQSAGDTEIQAFSSSACVGNRKIWLDLQAFHRSVVWWIEIKRQEQQEAERRRFEERIRQDRNKLHQAFVRLGSSLNFKHKRSATEVFSATPLQGACQLVADAMGIELDFSKLTDSGFHEGQKLEDLTRLGDFYTREVLLRDGWWKEDNGPLLAYTKADQHPIALLPISPRRYEMVDPATGARSPVTAVSQHTLAPVAYTLYRPFPPRPLSVKDLLNFALHGSYRDLAAVLGVGALGGVLGLLIPIMTGVIVDSVIPDAARGQLFQVAMILLVSVFAVLAFDLTRSIAMIRLEGRMDAQTQAAVIDRLLSLPAPFFRQFTAGDLASRSMGINGIRKILSGATLTAILTCVFSSINLVLLFWYDWQLALIGIGLTLLGASITGLLSAFMVRYQRKIADIQGRNYGIILQLFTGIEKIRVTGTEDRAFAFWADSFGEKKAIAMKTGEIKALLDTISSFLPLFSTMLIYLFFIKLNAAKMSTGSFLAFTTAYGSFQNAMLQMTQTLSNTLHAIPLFERARPILQTAPEATAKKEGVVTLSGRLQVDHIKFRYTPEGPLIVKDFSLQASPGEFVAIVGGSGAGKSTLLRLLLGFEKPESGVIYYDDQDLQDLDIRRLRRQIGVVLQNGQLQAGDIFKNIVGTANLNLEHAWEAARMVGLADDIQAMPMGMQTMIPPGGGNLSGGQRQRILIARAIVRRPKVLFFDEATSALDNRTQSLVTESIDKLQVTRIVIAHRLSTIMGANRIYVVQHGEVIEVGTYSELMDKKGFFYQLAVRQVA